MAESSPPPPTSGAAADAAAGAGEEPKSRRKEDIYLLAVRALFWIFFFGVVAFAIEQAWPVITWLLNMLTPFIVGLVLAYVFYPIVKVVQYRLKLGRMAGIIVVVLCILGLIVGFFAILLPILYNQIQNLIESITQFLNSEMADNFLRQYVPFIDDWSDVQGQLREGWERLRENWDEYMDAEGAEVVRPITIRSAEAVREMLTGVFGVIGWIGWLAAIVVLSAIVAFYTLLDMEKAPSTIRRLLPRMERRRIWDALLRCDEAVGGFIRGQLITCMLVGLLMSVLLFAVGLRQYAILIGFVAGAVNFIPYLGPIIGFIPAVSWALFMDEMENWTQRGIRIGFILGGFAAIQAIEGFIFQPYIVGRNAQMHPLTVLLALVVGAQFGLAGMIIAVPVTAAVQVFWVEFFWRQREDFLKPEAAGQA